MTTRSMGSLAACLLLPLALLACSDDEDTPSAATSTETPPDDTTADDTTPDDTTADGAPDLCALVDASQVEDILGAPPEETVPAEPTSGAAMCTWTVGTTAQLVAQAWAEGEDQPDLPDSVGGPSSSTGRSRGGWTVAVNVSFAQDPGGDVDDLVDLLADEIHDAVAG